MPYQKKVLPSARDEFTRISQTYGAAFTVAARKWRDGIVTAISAGAGERLIDVSIEELLDRALDPEDRPPAFRTSTWEYSRKRFREASWNERARAALVFFRSLSPPWEQRVTKRTFSALGVPDMLEMFAYFEVNHAEKSVVFTKFEVWTAR